ncbi:MAG TPA: tetratricopeptide repeat protein [Candidatus Acidoferrum sp.]|nr:tetratricopeptide repeat protein [Candidatus Acidoferrum sp.]
MKSSLPALLLPLLLVVDATALAANDLKLELPKRAFVLQEGEIPLTQREGQMMPGENDTVTKLVPQLADHKADQVLATLKSKYKDVLDQLEAGDPKGEIKQRVVQVGPFLQGKPNGLSTTLLYFIGCTYLELKNYAAAETAFKAALSAMPDYIRVHESLGVLYLLTDRYKDAQTHLSRAAQLGLNTSNLYGALGYLNMKLDNPFGAVSAYQTALMLEPDSAQWQQGLLASLTGSNQHAAGLALVEKLLKATPNDAELWVYRATLELDDGHKQLGLDSLEVAIRLGNDNVANLQVCAALHMELGSIDRAVSLLRAGMGKGLDFHYVDESMRLLAAREQWGALQKLLDEFKTTTGLGDVQQSHLLLHRANLSQHNNDLAQAKAQLQQAIMLDPTNADALLTLAQLQQKDKNYAQAELLLQRASANSAVAESATLLLAQVAIDQHNYTKALKLLRDVHAADPNRTDLARNIEALESLVQLQPGN